MTAPTYEDLREQVSDLRQRLAAATGQSLAGSMRTTFGTTNRGSRVLAMLYTCPGVVSVGLIYDEVFADPATGEGPGMDTVKIQIHYIRKTLREMGAPDGIVAEWGFGYRLTKDLRGWIAGRLSPVAVAA